MYGQALSQKVKFTETMKETFEGEFVLAAGSRDGTMRFEDYKRCKSVNPEYLSFIEDMEDGTFDGSNEKTDVKVALDDFKEYHGAVMKILDNT